MKRLFIAIILLGVVFHPPAARADYNFSDSSAHFSLKLPDGWTPLSEPQCKDLINLLSPTPEFRCLAGFTPPNSAENIPAVLILEAPYPDGKTHDTFSRAQVESLAASFGELKSSQIFTATSPAVPALVPSMNLAATAFTDSPGFVLDRRSKDKFRAHTVFFLGTDRIILLQFLADDAAYAELRPTADGIATSFSFTYFHRTSFEGQPAVTTPFEWFVISVILILLAAAVGGIFYAIYHRRPSDNI